jgi:DME family drug/metabolite transporter
MKNRALGGMIMVLLAAMLWGTTGTAQSLVPAGLPAHWVGALRLLVSSAFFGIYVAAGPRGHPTTAAFAHIQWGWVLLAGASMAAYNLTFFAGVKASSVAVGTAIALGSGPIWAGLLQLVVARRSPSGVWWVGTSLAVAGGSLMVLGSARQLDISMAGIGLCLTAGLSYAVYTLVSQRLVARTPPAIVTLSIFFCAALMAVPAAFVVSGFPAVSAQGWWIMAYLGVVATGVAYLLFTHALSRISGTTAVSMCLVEPLTAFCLAIVVIGERPPPPAFAGLALVMLGLALVMRAELRSSATIVSKEESFHG